MNTVITCGGAKAQLLRPISAFRQAGPRLIVGVTGGIGTGKTHVSSALKRLGATVADADEIARELTAPGGAAIDDIYERFGQSVFDGEGQLNRARLAHTVFNDPHALADLNAIMHPLIAARARQELNAAPDGALAVYDIPLLVESGTASQFDAVIVVDAPMQLRIERLRTRGMSETDARNRINSQVSDEERRAVASIWLENTGTTEDLERLSEDIVNRWLS